jgi:DNA-binding response OmpR family regulator
VDAAGDPVLSDDAVLSGAAGGHDGAMTADVLIVEDDDALREVLRIHLSADGLAVRAAPDGEIALAMCDERRPAVAVLDVMLPGRSGLEVCVALRERFDPSPGVLVLTARGDEADVLLGFDSGADDYVLKPCRPREVVARVRALLRRVEPHHDGAHEEAIVHGPLRIIPAQRAALVDGRPLRLTATELDLLALVARHPSRIFTRVELLEAVWRTKHAGYARNVDCHVARLRRKLEAAGLGPAAIETVHGAGYRFREGRS